MPESVSMTFIYPYETVNRDNTVFWTVFQILAKIQYGSWLAIGCGREGVKKSHAYNNNPPPQNSNGPSLQSVDSMAIKVSCCKIKHHCYTDKIYHFGIKYLQKQTLY